MRKRMIAVLVILCTLMSIVMMPLQNTLAADTSLDIGEYDVRNMDIPVHSCIWIKKYDSKEHWDGCTVCHAIKDRNVHVLISNGQDRNIIGNYQRTEHRAVCSCGYRSGIIARIPGRPENYLESRGLNIPEAEYGLGSFEQISYSEFVNMPWAESLDSLGSDYSVSVPGTRIEYNGYTWWDEDGDGLGLVFCGGLIASGYGLGPFNPKGSIALVVGSEGDCGRHIAGDEVYALVRYLGEAGESATKAGFVNWLPAKNTIDTDHLLYGYREKWAGVTDAQFNRLKAMCAKYAAVTRGLHDMGGNMWICCPGVSSLDAIYYAWGRCYDSTTNHYKDFVSCDGGGTCDVCGHSFTNEEAFELEYSNCYAGCRLKVGETFTCPGHDIAAGGVVICHVVDTYTRTDEGNYVSATATAKPGYTISYDGVDGLSQCTRSTIFMAETEVYKCGNFGGFVVKSSEIACEVRLWLQYPYRDQFSPEAYQHPGAVGSNTYWKVTGNGTFDSPSTSAKATVTFRDEYLYTLNQLRIRVYDSDKATLMPFFSGSTEMPLVNAEGTNYLWTNTFDIMTETTSSRTIYVQAIDSVGNKSEFVPLTISYLDSKPPVISPQSLSTAYAKTKTLTVGASDSSGTALLGTSASDMTNVISSGTSGQRSYTITGDVYGTKNVTFFAKDAAGNLSNLDVPVSNIDNTAPTITDAVSSLISRDSTITISAHDVNQVLRAVGSGVAEYAVTQSKDTIPVVWQDSNVFTVEDKGVYYAWAKDNVGNVSVPYAVGVQGVEYITATLNSQFTTTYASSFNGTAYDIDDAITVTNEMVDVVMHFTDGSTAAADSFTLSNTAIVGLDDNYVNVTLGGSTLSCQVRVNGYSSSLSSVMAELAVANGDYEALANKLSEMQDNIASLNADITSYNDALQDIKTSLATQGINVDLVGDLATRLSSVVSGVQTAVSTIASYKNQISQIQNKINDLLLLFSKSGATDGKLATILTQLNTLSTEINAANTKINTANGLRTELRQKLSLGDEASDAQIKAAVDDLNTRVANLESAMSLYAANLVSIRAKLATQEIDVAAGGTQAEDMQNTLDGVTEAVNKMAEFKSDIADLNSQVADLQGKLNNLATLLGVSDEGSGLYEAMSSKITEMKSRITNLTNTVAEYEQFKSDIIAILDLQSDASLSAIVTKVQLVSDSLDTANQYLSDSSPDIDLMASYLGVSLTESMTQPQKLDAIESKLKELKDTLLSTKNSLADYIQANIGGATSGGVTLPEYVSNIQANIAALEAEATTMLNSFTRLRTILGLDEDTSYSDVVDKVEEIYDELLQARADILDYEAAIQYIREQLSLPDTTGETSTLEEQLNNLKSGALTLSTNIQAMENVLEVQLALSGVSLEDADLVASKISDVKSDLADAQASITSLEAQLATVTAANATLQEAKEALEAQVASLTSQVNTLSSEKDALQVELETTREENASLIASKDNDLNAKDIRIGELTAELGVANSEIASLENTVVEKGAEILTLTGQNATLTDANEALEADVASKVSTISTLTNQLQLLTETKEDLEAQIVVKDSTIADLTADKQALIVEKAELTVEVNNLTASVESSRLRVEELEAESADKTVQINTLTSQNQTLTSRYGDLEDELAVIKAERVRDLAAGLDFATSLRDALGLSAEATQEAITTSIAKIKSDLAIAKETAASQAAEVVELRKKIDEGEIDSAERTELQEKITKLTSESKELTNRISTIEAILKDKLSLGDVTAVDAVEIGRLIDKLKTSVATSNQEISRLNSVYTEVAAARSTLEADNFAKTNEITQLKSQIASLTDNTSSLKSQLEKAQADRATLSSQNASLAQDLANMEADRDRLALDAGSSKEYEVKYVEITKTVEVIKTEVIELQKEVEVKEQAITVLTADKEALESEVETLEWYKDAYDNGGYSNETIPSKPDISGIDDDMPDIVDDVEEPTPSVTEEPPTPTEEPTPVVTEEPLTPEPTPELTPTEGVQDKLDDVDFGSIDVYSSQVQGGASSSIPTQTPAVTAIPTQGPSASAEPSHASGAETNLGAAVDEVSAKETGVGTGMSNDDPLVSWLIFIAVFVIVGTGLIVILKVRRK